MKPIDFIIIAVILFAGLTYYFFAQRAKWLNKVREHAKTEFAEKMITKELLQHINKIADS